MQNKTLSYTGIILGVVAIIISFLAFGSGSKGNVSSSSTVLDNVLSSGVIRAGYLVYPPYIVQDPKTGKLSGVYYDITNAIAEQLGLKVQWVEEAGYGTIGTSLSAGRYDVYAGIWPNPDRSKTMLFTNPAYYDTVYAYVRPNDHRFDNDLLAINSPNVKISTIDGEIGDSIAQQSFPGAQRVSLPQSTPFDQLELQVVDNKADVTFIPPTSADLYLKANPGTLRMASSIPVRTYGTAFSVRLGATDLQQMLNVAMNELINEGIINKIIASYNETSDTLPVAAPYSK